MAALATLERAVRKQFVENTSGVLRFTIRLHALLGFDLVEDNMLFNVAVDHPGFLPGTIYGSFMYDGRRFEIIERTEGEWLIYRENVFGFTACTTATEFLETIRKLADKPNRG